LTLCFIRQFTKRHIVAAVVFTAIFTFVGMFSLVFSMHPEESHYSNPTANLANVPFPNAGKQGPSKVRRLTKQLAKAGQRIIARSPVLIPGTKSSSPAPRDGFEEPISWSTEEKQIEMVTTPPLSPP
jgi:hypothetical protein